MVMKTSSDLVAHVAASTGLTPAEAARVVGDVVAYFATPVEDVVRRRHAELKTYGAKNPEIFARIAAELEHRVVAAPQLSERQLRRMIYG
ncbi:hypothetical protein GCM10023198_45330 [Promicromonospora umidemergens]|uniref:Uncharacterized protein n=2 Tax=Promicromonospora umidemergens TaxID=629679 RepID=A0ABP8XY83_9MICO